MAHTNCIVGDIGGTNARFAIASLRDGAIDVGDPVTFRCADFANVYAALESFGDSQPQDDPEAICLAVAGPIENGEVRFTNNEWVIRTTELGARFGLEAVGLINDFEAMGYAVPALPDGAWTTIGEREFPDARERGPRYTIAVVGPGTGLGAVAARVVDGRPIVMPGEGGHIAFAPATELQSDVLTHLRRRFERVSVERVLSGPGIENLHRAIAEIRRTPVVALSAQEVFARAAGDPVAGEAVELFFEILGQVAGDLALAFGAWDGVFIAGGVAQRYPELLRASRFRSAFEDKGRHSKLMQRVPTALVGHPQPGLLGAANAAFTEFSVSR